MLRILNTPSPPKKEKKKKEGKKERKKREKKNQWLNWWIQKLYFYSVFSAQGREILGVGVEYISLFPGSYIPVRVFGKKNEFEDKIIYDITHSNRILNGMWFIIYKWQYVFVNLWNITLNIYFKDYCTLYFVRVIYWCYEVSAFIQNISITKCENTKTRAKWQKKTWKNQTKRFYLALIIWLNTRRFINALIKEK